jgi:hypothetical protein
MKTPTRTTSVKTGRSSEVTRTGGGMSKETTAPAGPSAVRTRTGNVVAPTKVVTPKGTTKR